MKTSQVMVGSLLCLGIITLIGSGLALADKAPSNIPSTAQDRTEEAAIRKLYDEFEADWNAHEVDKLAQRWTIDGDYLEPDGRLAKGQTEVAEVLRLQHGSVFKKSTLDLTIKDVWFITSTVALVDGKYSLFGATDPKGNPVDIRAGHLTAVLLKEQGSWGIAASRLIIPSVLPWRDEAKPEATAEKEAGEASKEAD